MWPPEIKSFVRPFRTDETTSFWVLQDQVGLVVGALRFEGTPDTQSTVSRILFDDTIGQTEEIIKQIALQVFEKARADGLPEDGGGRKLDKLTWSVPPGHGSVPHLLKLGLVTKLPVNDSPRHGPIW